MRRMGRIVSVVVGAAMVVAGLTTAVGAQGEDATAWCQARVDVEAAFLSEDEAAIADTLATFASSAPAAIATESQAVADLLGEKGEAAFEDPAFNEALGAAEAYMIANCGFNVVEVSAIDYEFDGLPDEIPAGITVFSLSNDAPKEAHEIVIFRVNDDVKLSAKKLLRLPEKKVEKKITFVGATSAEPGDAQASVADLEPGRYVYACFLPTGGKKKGAPHFTKGMFGEFEVSAS